MSHGEFNLIEIQVLVVVYMIYRVSLKLAEVIDLLKPSDGNPKGAEK